MNFAQFSHTDYHYCSKEQIGEEEKREICGLQISWHTPPYETGAIGSFRFFVGRSCCAMNFDKDVLSFEPMICDGLIMENEYSTIWKMKICRSTDAALTDCEFNAKRLGAPAATVSFRWKKGSKEHSHHLVRVQGVAEFQKRLAAYCVDWVEWYDRPSSFSSAGTGNTNTGGTSGDPHSPPPSGNAAAAASESKRGGKESSSSRSRN